MKSKMSFFDPTLLKKNISRFAPAWGISLVMLLLTVSMSALREVDYFERGRSFLRDLAAAGPIVAAFSAIVYAALLFRYLHKSQAAYMMHAFPMTRTCQFVTNLISGLLFFLAPVLVIFLANLGAFAANGVSGCGSFHWAWLGKWTLEYLFFYGLAVFCMFLSGSQFISVLSYAALNFIFLLIPVVSLEVIDMYFYGFDKSLPRWVAYLSPVVGMMERSEVSFGRLACYACVGAVLLGLAWLFYRQRHVERAGDAMVFLWAEKLFRLVFTFCVGLYFGMVFTSIYEEGFLFFVPIGLFLGWFGATMLLERTVKVFKLKKAWLGYGIFVLALFAVIGAMQYDVLGWQRRVPELEEVQSVKVWSYNYQDWAGLKDSDLITLTEPDQIERVRTIHQNALSHRSSRSDRVRLFNNEWCDLFVEYQLKDGSTLHRAYNFADDESEELRRQLYSDPANAGAWYEETLPKTIIRGSVDINELGYSVQVYDPTEENESLEWRNLVCSDGSALRAALVADAAAGRLPIDCYKDGKYWNYGDTYILLFLECEDDFDVRVYLPPTATETLKLFGLAGE